MLETYITLNAGLGRIVKNDFERDTFKLINNAIFGKTKENLRLPREIKLVTNCESRYGAEAYLVKPNFHRYTILETCDDFVGIELFNKNITFDRPIYVGMSILHISKTVLYKFHYEYIKRKYGKCNLLYTDIDSLFYELYTEDVYKDMRKDIHRFDTTGYEPNNIYNILSLNKKVLGVMTN